MGTWGFMADSGDQRLEAGKGAQNFRDDDQTWARIVQGAPQGSSWMSHRISLEEIKQLQAYFSRVLELPEVVLDASRRQWEGLAVVMRSLGRRVPREWIFKEVRTKFKLDYDLEIFPLVEDHLVV